MLAAMAKWAWAFRLFLVVCVLLGAACKQARPATARSASNTVRSTPPTITEPTTTAAVTSLYAAEEALRDARSGPLEYVGAGPWPGNQRIQACVFRNARVLVVNVYCTPLDKPAFRIDVYSPTRGRVRIYAESNGTVFSHVRQDYFSFMVESEQPPSSASGVPALSTGMSFDDLRDYEQKRYGAYLPACYGGIEHRQQRGGCLGALAPRAPSWLASQRTFLEQANSDWYLAMRALHTLAGRYGREPD